MRHFEISKNVDNQRYSKLTLKTILTLVHRHLPRRICCRPSPTSAHGQISRFRYC